MAPKQGSGERLNLTQDLRFPSQAFCMLVIRINYVLQANDLSSELQSQSIKVCVEIE